MDEGGEEGKTSLDKGGNKYIYSSRTWISAKVGRISAKAAINQPK